MARGQSCGCCASASARGIQRNYVERGFVNIDYNFFENSRDGIRWHLSSRRSNIGFTLIELLVVIAIIGILASLLLPGLIRAKNHAWAVKCLSNMKQFSYAWVMYAGDNNDSVPPNEGSRGAGLLADNTWVRGWLQLGKADWADNTNTLYLINSHLGTYLSYSTGVWHCPADKSSTLHSGRPLLRVRSYSMNNYLNSPDRGVSDPWKIIRKVTDMTFPPPCSTFVIIDEREDSIQDCYFVVDMENAGAPIVTVPRSAHNGAGTLSFGDGHSELKKWRDPRTCPALNPTGFVEILQSERPANMDGVWLRERTTGRK